MPNRSLTDRQRRGFLAILGIAVLSVAAFCAAAGFWMVLPFAGLEFTLVWLGFHLVWRRGQDYEQIEIDADQVTVMCKRGSKVSQHRFVRYWTRVELLNPVHRWYPTRLYLGSHGRRIELGSCLVDEDRRSLADELKRLLAVTVTRAGDRSVPGPAAS